MTDDNGPNDRPDESPTDGRSSPGKPPTIPRKIADRPHRITIALGLLSPLLALVSLGVSFYVFRDSQRSMRVAQRAYLGFYFKSAEVMSKPGAEKPFQVRASVTAKDLGNTPAYIENVKTELFAIEGDDIWDHIGGETMESPNFNPIGPNDSLPIEYSADFSERDFTGDRGVVYRIEINWHDAFNEAQPPTVYCGILRDVSLPIIGKKELSAEPCMKGMTFTFAHD